MGHKTGLYVEKVPMTELTLHWSPRSPFVRKVMLAAHELGVVERLNLVRTVVTMSDPNPAIMADNPLGRIPTLVRDDGLILVDSAVICEFLDDIAGGGIILPRGGDERWRELSRHAAATGMLEILILWRNERDKSEAKQTAEWLAAFEMKVKASLRRFEADVRPIDHAPLRLSCIALGCVLSYLDLRFGDFDWRSAYPALTQWHSAFRQRPSAVATEIIDA
jgi:glutathione S-transferase